MENGAWIIFMQPELDGGGLGMEYQLVLENQAGGLGGWEGWEGGGVKASKSVGGKENIPFLYFVVVFF